MTCVFIFVFVFFFLGGGGHLTENVCFLMVKSWC